MEFDPWIAENWRDKKPQLRAAGVPEFYYNFIITLSLSLSLALCSYLFLRLEYYREHAYWIRMGLCGIC